MSIQSGRQQFSTPWGTVLFALLGLLWCGYVAFPTNLEPHCITSGCDISRSFSIGGVSLWWVGGAYFFLLLVLCLRGRRYIAWRLSRLGLLLDAILLGIMFFTGPCVDCLLVAIFIGITTWLVRPPADGWFKGDTGSPLLFPLWFGLLLGNGIVALDETAPRWIIANEDSSSIIQVHFSPSCPWCREAVKILGAKEKAALYPVLEEDGDFNALLRFESYLASGVPMEEAIDRCLNVEAFTPDVSLARKLLLHVQLLRNKSFLLQHPKRSMPLIEINGMPESWLPSSVLSRGAGSGTSAVQSSSRYSQGVTEGMAGTTPGTMGQGMGDGGALLPQSSHEERGTSLPWEEGGGFKYCDEGDEEPCD